MSEENLPDRLETARLVALTSRLTIEAEQKDAEITRLRGEVERLATENTDLKEIAVSFCGVWGAQYAREHGAPDMHLHPTHYDILERCGARMNSFVRAETFFANLQAPKPEAAD